MSNERVLYEVVDRVAIVTKNRPEYRNAQSWQLLEDLEAAFNRAVADRGVRAIVLRGNGDHFSAGHDTGSPEQRAYLSEHPLPDGPRGIFERNVRYSEFSLRYRNVPKPTIAAVHGACIWGGWMVATSMDVLFASDDAYFLPALFQYFDVPWSLGPRLAKAVLYENRVLSAREACDYGFVYRVVPRAELDAEVMAYARRVCEEDPFEARMIKRACNQAEDIMGFTASIHNGHDVNMLKSISNAAVTKDAVTPAPGPRRHMGRVDRAVARFRARRMA